MLTRTSISAIRALLYVTLRGGSEPVSLGEVASSLGESPTYLAKVSNRLVKSGILVARRGAAGGIALRRPAEEVTLLSIVEACQGTILGNFCRGEMTAGMTCSFHVAAVELHEAIVGVLAHWTLAQLARKPCPPSRSPAWSHCSIGDVAKAVRPMRASERRVRAGARKAARRGLR
jgi:Rrf2 family protein